MGGSVMAGNIRLYNTSGYVELQAPASASAQTLVLPTDSIQPGLVHLHTETFSGVSSVSIDDVFDATYQNYLMTIDNSISQGAELRFQWRSSGSPVTSGYRTAWSITTDSGAIDDGSFASTSRTTGFINYQGYANSAMYSSCSVINPFESTYSQVVATIGAYGPSNQLNQGTSSTAHTSVASHDGISIQMQAGTMSGSIRIYGYRNN